MSLFRAVGMLFAFCAVTAHAGIHDAGFAMLQLESLLTNLHEVKENLHSLDTPRILVFERAVQAVRVSIETKGLAHRATSHLYQVLPVRFKFSHEFFQFIRTKRSQQAIASLFGTLSIMRRDLGVDEEPHSRSLEAHFRQLKDTVDELLARDGVSPPYQARLRALVGDLGDAIAVASLGMMPRHGGRPQALPESKRALPHAARAGAARAALRTEFGDSRSQRVHRSFREGRSGVMSEAAPSLAPLQSELAARLRPVWHLRSVGRVDERGVFT